MGVCIGTGRMDAIVCYRKVLFGFYPSCLFAFAPHSKRCCALCQSGFDNNCFWQRKRFSVHLHFAAVAFSVKGVAFPDTVVRKGSHIETLIMAESPVALQLILLGAAVDYSRKRLSVLKCCGGESSFFFSYVFLLPGQAVVISSDLPVHRLTGHSPWCVQIPFIYL